jgi:hypothetical protein
VAARPPGHLVGPTSRGLRALAVLLVVAFYAGLPVPSGFMGVDVFFALSGFAITTMLLSELESEDEFCDARRCQTSRDGTILYRDADHLSVDGSLTLTDRFYRAIEALAR